MDRAEIVHQNFLRRVRQRELPSGRPPTPGLRASRAVALFRAQCLSRALDLEARAMQKAGQGYYTIGSSGHEGMAALAAAARPDDPAFLHYRDAAFRRRPRPSPAICPRPWARPVLWGLRGATRPSTACLPKTPSFWPPSEMPPPTTPPRRAPSTRQAGPPGSRSPCRFSSSARTTASAFPSGRRRAGSRQVSRSARP